MKRDERIAFTLKLLNDGRLSYADISQLVGRSRRWVQKIARTHPHNPRIQVVYPPSLAPNVANADGKPKKARTARHRSRRSIADQVWRGVKWIGVLGFLAAWIIAALRGDLVVDRGRLRLKYRGEGGPMP
jgi:hypothetical protein